jgi:putative Holliday junction resolvase
MASNIVSLDVGERRVGVAIASVIAKLPRPLTTLENTDDIWAQIDALATEHDAETIVVGLPRNLSGDDTAQTLYVRTFAEKLSDYTVEFQDEALTSQKAEKELNGRGKPFAKGDIDALAATYILEDYLTVHGARL